ncbi:unnamed protein product [Moneuplotes crassus]|uniref:Uncharacterized protein n=1 Tax=Euplotes crassus TaxID=5936 RepID=A0AAD2CZK7_EUPCR|nr:unnamed protein product [Moneuplotes crassus]
MKKPKQEEIKEEAGASKSGKLRSQEYRNRKKQYIVKLEDLNKTLRDENLLLK